MPPKEDSILRCNQFAEKHGFLSQGTQAFKNCLLIKFDFGGKTIRRQRIIEKTEFQAKVFKHFEKQPPISFSDAMDTEGRLVNLGIYLSYHWDRPYWAIPNEFSEVQAFVIQYCPIWAKQWHRKF